MFLSTENKEAEYSFEEIQKAMNELVKKGKEIPFLTLPEPFKTAEGKWEKVYKKTNVIDKEKLLFPYHFFNCYQFKGFLMEEINKRTVPTEPPAKTTTTGKQLSFKYIGNSSEQDNINHLFEDLKKDKFITAETELKNFKKIFSGKAIETPVVWTGKISELYYFIKQLHQIHRKVEDVKQDHWKIAILCFVKPDGKTFDLKKLKSQKDPVITKAIDRMVKAL